MQGSAAAPACTSSVGSTTHSPPTTAARLRGLAIPSVAALALDTARLAGDHDITLVEGAGGVAVRLDTDGETLLTLAGHLVEASYDVRVVVVTSLALGTLNHTELTMAAVRAAGLVPAGLVVGSVPAELGLAERCNIEELPRVTGVPLRGMIPAGVGGWEPGRFQHEAVGWLDAQTMLGII
ncbi:MAG: AAA family ATPase [Nocardioidaceae bacterium]